MQSSTHSNYDRDGTLYDGWWKGYMYTENDTLHYAAVWKDDKCQDL
jgi:hypothetical protein